MLKRKVKKHHTRKEGKKGGNGVASSISQGEADRGVPGHL